MKKAIKKLMAALLAVAMLCAMAVPAFAASASNDGKIIINNAVNGQTYDAYRIFDLESFVADKAYSYTLSSKWADAGFATSTAFTTYFELDNGYVKARDTLSDSTAATFAKAALAFAQENDIAADATKTASSTTVTLDKLALGYYLVDTSVGSLCMLDTTAKEATIIEKNDVPDIEKTIISGTTPTSTSGAKIGDAVKYQVVIHAKEGAVNYVLTDTMTAGLTFNNDVVIKDATGKTLAINDDYTVTTDASNNSFKVVFTKSYLDGLTAKNTDITVTYSATVNSNALVKDEGDGVNKNTAKLEYGNHAETEPKFTETYVYKFDLVKTNQTNELLADAHFSLYEDEACTKLIKLVKVDDTTYRVADTKDTTTTTDIVTVKTGIITIKGLDAKTYYLKETKAPEGYNKLDAAQPVNLSAGNNIANMTDDTIYVDGGVHIINKAGTILPGTGGIGTTIFYVVGGGLMVAAAVLLITKKRMENK